MQTRFGPQLGNLECVYFTGDMKKHILLFRTKNILSAILFIAFVSCASPSPEIDENTSKLDSSFIVSDTIPLANQERKTAPRKNVYKGQASFYNDSFQDKKTASGDLYDKNAFTAAIKQSAISVKFGTIVEVHYTKKNKSVLVKVNDIMSESSPSIIDLSYAAAEEIGLIQAGRAAVVITVLAQDSATMARFEAQGK